MTDPTRSPPDARPADPAETREAARLGDLAEGVTGTGDADPDATPARAQASDQTVGPPPGPPPPMPAAPPGFAVEREIGVGGMGVVYLARQQGLNRPVALKLVKDRQAVNPKSLIRFLAEAEAVAAVRHPNVVEVYQYGEHAGRLYLALEYCPGGDLTSHSKAEPTRDADWFRRVAGLLAGVADGVQAAHAQGIVHRDLKPHNVFLTADGTPKVADFGLAKRGLGSDLTHTGAILGTPAYMSPEQAGGRTKFVGPEADVWALGVILYELCCGDRPIDTSGPQFEALARVAKADVPQLRVKCPAVPKDLALVTHKCLSSDPRGRYPTAGGVAADLRNWLDGRPISARPVGAVEQAVKWARRNKRLAATAAGVGLVLLLATCVSVGFGLEANKQADIARDEKKKTEEAARDADQAGALVVTDRERAHARALPTHNPSQGLYAWWVFLPDGQHTVKVAIGNLPKDGYPSEKDGTVVVFSPRPLAVGRTYLFKMRIWKDNKHGRWMLDVPSPEAVASLPIPKDGGVEEYGSRTYDSIAARGATLRSGEDRLVLFRQLHLRKPPEQRYTAEAALAMPVAWGMMVWIERARPPA